MNKQNNLIAELAVSKNTKLREANSLIYELHQCLLLKSSLEGHREPFATRVALVLDRAEKYLSEVK